MVPNGISAFDHLVTDFGYGRGLGSRRPRVADEGAYVRKRFAVLEYPLGAEVGRICFAQLGAYFRPAGDRGRIEGVYRRYFGYRRLAAFERRKYIGKMLGEPAAEGVARRYDLQLLQGGTV